jgi:alpha-galactosidase
VHAYSEEKWWMWGNCSTLSATVGIDDEVPAGLGSVDFQVWGDNTKLWDSGYLKAGSPAPSFNVNVSGYQVLDLIVTNGIYQAAAWQVPVDHADWANAIITCAN